MRSAARGRFCVWATLVMFGLVWSGTAFAVPPVVKTVPWVASNPLIPHDTYPGKSIRLKGTTDVFGTNISYRWSFGDGTPDATGTVTTTTSRFAIEASHTYAGVDGTVFTATLTVTNTTTNEAASKQYFVKMNTKTLPIEVNVAIDEGLWYLHKTQRRTTEMHNGANVDFGDWFQGTSCGALCASSNNQSNTAVNLNAFEVNGHLQNGSSDNPYTETVARGMRRIFTYLQTLPFGGLGVAGGPMQTNPRGTFSADANANGYVVALTSHNSSGHPMYETGQIMDAIIAAGTPNAVATTGEVAAGADPGIVGRTHSSIIQDLVDLHAHCQDDSQGAGWDYECNTGSSDHSTSQWAAVGLIPSLRVFGSAMSPVVKTWNADWLQPQTMPTGSQLANGSYPYRSDYLSPLWGPFATTPSGMVQLVLDGIGRGDPRWNKAETFIRDNFNSTSTSATSNIKEYYYGLFSMTKAMLLHDSNNDGLAEPIQMLQSQTAGVPPIDWYSAQAAPNGADPANGVARTLVGHQRADGAWTAHTYNSAQYPYTTAWAIIMLNRTIFQSGAPVAVIVATPNPAVAFQTINFNGGNSFHQDAAKQIVSWMWDLDNNGTFEKTGVQVTGSFPAVGNYPVKLKVCDNSTPPLCNETTATVMVNTPPLAPTAHAGGPYSFCTLPGLKFFLDGSLSSNPDDGQSEPGRPPDMIIARDWDLDGNGMFNDATGNQPDVTSFFTMKGLGSYLVQLKVTDNTATSYPSSMQPNLTDTDSAQVTVRGAQDPACACNQLTVRPKPGENQLTWNNTNPAGGYNVYRSLVNGGPYVKIATTASTWSTYLDVGLTNGTTYYYVIRQALLNGQESCQSNQASGMPRAR